MWTRGEFGRAHDKTTVRTDWLIQLGDMFGLPVIVTVAPKRRLLVNASIATIVNGEPFSIRTSCIDSFCDRFSILVLQNRCLKSVPEVPFGAPVKDLSIGIADRQCQFCMIE